MNTVTIVRLSGGESGIGNGVIRDGLHLSQLLTLDSFVFCSLNKPCDPSMLSHDFAIIAKKAGLKEVRFHDLRHTFASLALEQGAPAKVISEALGHALVAFTLQTYAHVLSGMQEKAMELLNDVLPEGVKKQTGTFLAP
ncbi:tyrosine-type recombinase/integrase [Chloroflexota bacterium]